jgi:hypothetical protein
VTFSPIGQPSVTTRSPCPHPTQPSYGSSCCRNIIRPEAIGCTASAQALRVLLDRWRFRSHEAIAVSSPVTDRLLYHLSIPTTELIALQESAAVKVFGRLHDDPIRARRRQAYEKRQWTKSRDVELLQCSGLHEGLIETRALIRADGTWSDQVDGGFKRVMPFPF